MFRKFYPGVFIAILLAMLILGYVFKDNLNNFISEKMKSPAGTEIGISAEELINSKYNYSQNGLNYEFTLLEFGSTGCTICKQMEGELDKIRNSGSNQINVVFLNTMFPENQNLVKYFGISAIPMQVMLDKNGSVFFKHYGFISAEDLIAKAFEYSSNHKNEK